MEIINENKEAGEPAPKNVDIKVNDEIKWGSQFISKRKKECFQCISPKPFQRETKQENETKITIWRPKGYENTNVKKPYQKKMLGGSLTVNRAALSPKQHIKLLAEPKKLRFNTHIKKPLTRPPMICSPRIVQLAAPSTRKVITLWQDFQYTLPVQKVDKLAGLLNANSALDQRDANICFKDIEKEKQRQHRKELCKQKKICLKRLRIKRKCLQKQTEDFAEKAAVYICNSKMIHVSNYEKVLADKIIDILITKHKIHKFNRKSTSGKEYINASFHCATFVNQILMYLESSHVGSNVSVSNSSEEQESGDGVEEIQEYVDRVLETLSDFKEEEEEEENEGDEDEEDEDEDDDDDDDDTTADINGEGEGDYNRPKNKHKDKKKKKKKGAVIKLDINGETAKLLQILQAYYNNEVDKEQRVFSSLDLPFVTLKKTLQLLQEDIACKMAAENDSRLQLAFEEKITNWVWQTQPDVLNEPMKETIAITSQELAIQLYRDLQSGMDVTKMRKELLENEGEDGAPLAIQNELGYELCPCIVTDPEKLREIFEKCRYGIPEDCKTCLCLKEYSKLLQEKQETMVNTFEEDERSEVGSPELVEPQFEETEEQITPEKIPIEPVEISENIPVPEELAEKALIESPEPLTDSPEAASLSSTEPPPSTPPKEEKLEKEIEQTEEKKEIEVNEEEKEIEVKEEIKEKEEKEEPPAAPSPTPISPESVPSPTSESPLTSAVSESALATSAPESVPEETGSVLSGAESVEETSAKAESSTSSKVESIGSSVLMRIEPEEIIGELDAQFLNITHDINLMPHSPDMVCCASLKAWAIWIKDVAENAKNWCKWITKVINDMRYMTAVMRGEIIDPVTGRVERLKREQWTAFVVKLDEDVVAWRHYNQYIQNTTDEIVGHFKDKRVACCDLCVQENLIINDIGAEHLNEQLAEALSTTQYWQKWLQKMVDEAETLSAIIDNQNTTSTTDIDSVSTGRIPPRLRSKEESDSQHSYYVIENVGKKKKK